MQTVLRLCEVYPGICLTTEEKQGKPSVIVTGECQLALVYGPYGPNVIYIEEEYKSTDEIFKAPWNNKTR
jgi:hypothetical protein